MSENKKDKRKILTIGDLADRLKPIYEELRSLMCEGVKEEAEKRYKDDEITKSMWLKSEIDRRSAFSVFLSTRVMLSFTNNIHVSRFLSLPPEIQGAISLFGQLIRHGIMDTLKFIAESYMDAGVELKDGDIEQLLYLIVHTICSEATLLAVELRDPTIETIMKALAMKKALAMREKSHEGEDNKPRFNYLA